MTGDRRGVRRAVQGLLDTARAIGERYRGKSVHLREGPATGVWTDQGKLASVGVQVCRGVLLHGLAINIFRTPQSFYGLKPCGLDAQVDFLLEQPNESVFLEIPNRLVQELSRHFWIQG